MQRRKPAPKGGHPVKFEDVKKISKPRRRAMSFKTLTPLKVQVSSDFLTSALAAGLNQFKGLQHINEADVENIIPIFDQKTGMYNLIIHRKKEEVETLSNGESG